MEKAIVKVKKGEARSLKAGGLWIYDNEIDRIEGEFENGDMVFVEDFDGYPLGHGFINTKSKITVRIMSRKKDTVIDDAFIEMRVRNAWEYRKTTVDTSSCRVIFGEADFLPGIVIDKFSDVLVVEANNRRKIKTDPEGRRYNNPRRLRTQRCKSAPSGRDGADQGIYR